MNRNIVLVTSDSLRADHCGFMGYERDTTPTLDAMAEEGVLFENAIAPGPSTPISMPRVFTGNGTVCTRDGEFNSKQEQTRHYLDIHRTIPDRMSHQGYTTIGFTPNPFTSRYYGYSQGFDYFEDFLNNDDKLNLRGRITSRWVENKFVGGLRFGINMIGLGDSSMTWEDYYERILSTIDSVKQPFLLWVFLLEPHWPYRPPARHNDGISRITKYYLNWKSSNLADVTPSLEEAKKLKRLYDGTIRHVDEFVNQLYRDLADKDPIMIFHADHGEAFGEHGNFGHGPYLYEENVHVPFVVVNTPESDTVSSPTSLTQLPSILESIANSDGRLDWADYTDSWAVPRVRSKTAVRGEDWKFISRDDETEIYDIENDPNESNTLELSDHDYRLLSNIECEKQVAGRELELIIRTTGEVSEHV